MSVYDCRFTDLFCFYILLSSNAQDYGVEESIFQNPAKLHLTIGTLVLLNDTEVRKASEHLQECHNTIKYVSKHSCLSVNIFPMKLEQKLDLLKPSDSLAGMLSYKWHTWETTGVYF